MPLWKRSFGFIHMESNRYLVQSDSENQDNEAELCWCAKSKSGSAFKKIGTTWLD